MRRLLLSLLFLFAFGVVSSVFGVDWGKITVYASWEVTTDFGTGDVSAHGRSVYVAIGSAKQVFPETGYPMPPPGPANSLTLYVSSDAKHYTQVANRVSFDVSNPSSFETEWLVNFSTYSGMAANLTFKCLSNDLPNPEKLTLRLLAVEGDETKITAVTAGATQNVAVASADGPNTLMATYEVSFVEGVEYALSLAPGWNLAGIPFERVTDAGALFEHPVMAVGPSVVRVTAASELASGGSYWIYNGASETVTVTLTGSVNTAREETAFPALATGWNYVSPVGSYDTTAKAFRAATEMISGLQFQWDATGQYFGEFEQLPALGRGYMVRE